MKLTIKTFSWLLSLLQNGETVRVSVGDNENVFRFQWTRLFNKETLFTDGGPGGRIAYMTDNRDPEWILCQIARVTKSGADTEVCLLDPHNMEVVA